MILGLDKFFADVLEVCGGNWRKATAIDQSFRLRFHSGLRRSGGCFAGGLRREAEASLYLAATATATAAAAATATATAMGMGNGRRGDVTSEDEIQESLHCGGKSAAFGRDDVLFG